MSRTANEKRAEELLDAIVRYLVRHGLSELSLRPLAKAIGSSPRVLLYYYGSKEKMLVKILAQLRQRQRATFDQIQGASFAQECWAVWKHMSAPASEPVFRLFFEAYGLALRHPQRYKDFLKATIEDWLEFLAGTLSQRGCSRKAARGFATQVLAGFRGFMLDYCATRDRKRLDGAVKSWLQTLDAIPLNPKEAHFARRRR